MTLQRESGVHLCSGMLQKMRKNPPLLRILQTLTLTLGLLWLTGSATGCMPAQRISGTSGSQTRSGEDARILGEAGTRSSLGALQRRLIVASQEWLGTPYSYGGNSSDGVDCSAFVRAVFGTAGISLPRTSREQSQEGRSIPISQIEPGDLLFFNTTGSGVSHVGMSIGGTRFVHASSSRGVIVSSLEETYYRERFLFARRML